MSQKPKGIDKLLKRMAQGGRIDNEERKLRKRAAEQRKASRKKQKRKKLRARDLEGDLEELGGVEKLRRARSDSLDSWVQRLDDGAREEAPTSADLTEAQVLTIGPGWCQVEIEGSVLECELAREIAETQRTSLAVGDRVLVKLDAEPGPRLEEVLPRSSLLTRSDPGRRRLRRAIVANVDRVVIVASVRTPPLHPRLFDRYLVAIRSGGAEAVLCINKIDLLESEEERAQVARALEAYRGLGLTVVLCSASTGEGLPELEDAVRGKLCAFVGHSGVGKSSVLSAICPGAAIDTGDVSDADGKGRHTTTTSRLYRLESGARVIDTPGIREFGLANLTLDELRAGFSDIEELARDCRFKDCMHDREPGCAVLEAVAVGRLETSRHESWLRLLGEIE